MMINAWFTSLNLVIVPETLQIFVEDQDDLEDNNLNENMSSLHNRGPITAAMDYDYDLDRRPYVSLPNPVFSLKYTI